MLHIKFLPFGSRFTACGRQDISKILVILLVLRCISFLAVILLVFRIG